MEYRDQTEPSDPDQGPEEEVKETLAGLPLPVQYHPCRGRSPPVTDCAQNRQTCQAGNRSTEIKRIAVRL